ncbi:phosphotyrosine protein, partial [Punctularia strigosozonata HHB-11173 SS5]|uniref:phosphotyrosine protein n=1 Tax=Punctularia strigosozonata (strain HHB-11173) TaxID=741275 RepID=UPI0004416E2A
ASEILPRLYLSDFLTALDDSELARLGITHVVSVLRTAPTFPAHIRTLHVEIDDIATEDILAHLAVTTAFIKDALAEGPNTKVLVHCLMGMSRSATVVCAYLIATTEMVADEAVAFVKERRSIVQPNPGFMRQL